ALIIFMVFHPSIQHRGCYLDCVFVPHRKNPLLSARLKSVPSKRNCRALQLRSTTWKFYVQLQCFISRQWRSTGPFSCFSQQTSAEGSYAFSAALRCRRRLPPMETANRLVPAALRLRRL